MAVTARFCVVLLMTIPSCRGALKEVTWRVDASMKDAIFHRHLLFDTTESRSVIDCGRQCARTEECVTFTFTRQATQRGECRGHSSSMTSQSDRSSSPETDGFTVVKRKVESRRVGLSSWVHSTCARDSECPASNAICFRRQCLCIPGYYYSHKGDNCVATCSEAQLQGSFMLYSGGHFNYRTQHHGLPGFHGGSTLHECEQRCRRTSNCRAITFFERSGTCKTYHVTPLNADGTHTFGFPDISSHVYSQRTCA